MKRIFTIITLLATIIFAGCTNLDDVYRQLDEQEGRLTALKARLKTLEELKDNTNSEITTIKTLIEAVNKKISVVSYRELDDKSGYELTMSDGSKITLKHGAKGVKGDPGKKGEQGEKGDDGITPAINVKRHTDGLLYWTINGEWLRDANGNMVPAEGKDGEEGKPGAPGANGITPLLQINADFYWEVSFDEGKTWKPVIGADGKPVLAQGPKGEPGQDGDANLTITETDDVVIIVYRGVTYVISKSVSLPTMTFTTSKNEGEKIIIWFDASEADRPDVWIDLNNNGERDPGEEVVFRSHRQYTVISRTVTVHGKVTELELPVAPLTELDVSKNPHLVKLVCGGGALESINLSANTELTEFHCFYNQLTSLDVSNNTKLKNLSCYGNNISDTDMEVLVNSLPDRNGKEAGTFRVINPTSPDEGNDITADQIATATAKNWQVLDNDGNPYTPLGDFPNPLSLVAEYNVNPAGTGFVTSLTACNVSGYFNFDDAVSKFTNITISGKRYHLPSKEEWQSIVPDNSTYVYFTNANAYNDISETVTVQGVSITMTSDFRTGVNGISYALRYKGTDLVSAWRYEYISDGNNTHMKITSRSLKGQTGVTVDDIAKPMFWSANAGKDVTRYFPAGGFLGSSSLVWDMIYGLFWSSSPNTSDSAWYIYFTDDRLVLYHSGHRLNGFTVRLFVSGD